MASLRWITRTAWIVTRAALVLALLSLFAPARRVTINRRTGEVRLT